MSRYLLTRLARALLTAIGVVTAVFLLVRAIPGDPVEAILGEQASPEDRALMRARLHLDDPLPVQYLRFGEDVLDGSMGTSFRHGVPVSTLLADVAWPTIQLAFGALLLALALALPLGVLAAAYRGERIDRLASLFATAGLAIPNIWLGPMLILLFAVQLRWLPLPGDEAGPTLLLPVVTLGTALCASLTRQTRAACAKAFGRPHVRAARARGLSRWMVLGRHGLRTALLPILTVAVAQLGALLSGTVVIEKIFERPGVGSLFLEAFFARDIPVIQGVVLVVALLYVFLNLTLDLAYAWLDPRVRLESSS